MLIRQIRAYIDFSNGEVLPVSLLTHLTEIFAITDLIIFLTGVGMLGVLVLVARMSSREY